MVRQVGDRWVGTTGILALLALWQVGAWLYNPVVLPSPLATFEALVGLAVRGRLVEPAVRTVLHSLGGFTVAAFLGAIVGMAAGMNPLLRRAVWPAVTVLQGMPTIAWIVLALLWFGTGDTPALFTVALACLPIVFVGALEGVATVDRNLLQMARSYRASLGLLLTDVYLPHLLSYLFPAMVTGLGIAWKVALTAELLASDKGIGADFGTARVNLNTAEAMAWVVVMLALMFAFEYAVVHPLKRWLEPWRRTELLAEAAAQIPAQAAG